MGGQRQRRRWEAQRYQQWWWCGGGRTSLSGGSVNGGGAPGGYIVLVVTRVVLVTAGLLAVVTVTVARTVVMLITTVMVVVAVKQEWVAPREGSNHNQRAEESLLLVWRARGNTKGRAVPTTQTCMLPPTWELLVQSDTLSFGKCSVSIWVSDTVLEPANQGPWGLKEVEVSTGQSGSH